MKKRFGWLTLIVLMACSGFTIYAGPAAVNPELLSQRWSARWIAHEHHADPTVSDYRSPFAFGVYHFRRSFSLDTKPPHFIVHVTADQRYQLYVNGTRVVWGPARADLKHWRYESVDIAPQLRAGRNVLAAVVWNFAENAPVAQNTARTAFLLQGDSESERIVDTGAAWRVFHNTAWEPLPVQMGREVLGYWAAGAGERIHGERHPWGWESLDFDGSAWARPQLLSHGSPRASRDAPNPWMLMPRDIPLMEERPQPIPYLRLVEGPQPPGSFPLRAVPHPIGARRKTRLILDQGELTTGYPELVVSGGKGTRVRMRYAEALYRRDDAVRQRGRPTKGNREEIEGKEFVGYFDEFVLEGGANRLYRPLWWRTWRYIEVTIETANEPATVEALRATFTAYPFVNRSILRTSDAAVNEELERMLEVGWRTARLCAHENYVDCPYYEQLQYVGDTRIQALISYYATGDARLARQAIERIDATRTPEGLTYSRAPSELQQYIPPFSLWWIGMVHDYWMHVGDEAFLRGHLKGMRAILQFFRERQQATGSVGPLPWWNFVDWAWPGGTPPRASEGNVAAIDLQLLLALDWAAQLERALGSAAMAKMYAEQAAQLRSVIPAMYWDGQRGLFADTPSKDSFSQQTNALAILAGLVTGDEATRLFDTQWADRDITKATVYFRFYTHAAARVAGRGDHYLQFLDPWRDMLALQLTTWAEQPEPSRSDCHAWSSSPNYEMFRTMLGIAPDAPGFARIRIEPHLGTLRDLEGSMPHPKGVIRVGLRRTAAGLEASVALPDGVPGSFVWQGTERALQPGENRLVFP